MAREYNPDSEREYTAPKKPIIVEPEPMISKWIKHPISKLILWVYLVVNSSGFTVASIYRNKEMSKSEIEEKIDKGYGNKKGLEKFVFDDFAKPGRELAYLIFGDGETNKNGKKI